MKIRTLPLDDFPKVYYFWRRSKKQTLMKRQKKEQIRPKAAKISISMPEPVYTKALAKTRAANQWNFSHYIQSLVKRDLEAA